MFYAINFFEIFATVHPISSRSVSIAFFIELSPAKT